MKISSRSVLSPGRTGSVHNPTQISLSASLCRRLTTSRSIKGAASPAMFPTTTTWKKRGCGLDNPEPTSPKVTCIGQVRVKSKKKHSKNNLRSLSKRRNTTGGVGFSKLEHTCSQRIQSNNNNNNQRWVHLPLTICEALRTFGSEVSCLFPCRSSCSSSIEKEEKMGNRQGTCAVFARWLVALNDGDDAGDKREIELVFGNDNVNDNDKDDNDDDGKLRRHVFEDLEIVNDSIIGSKEEARVSICVPPKNALLLMRCRSDPMKMEALTNRFWGPVLDQNDEQIEDEDKCNYDEKIMVLDGINDQEIVEINSEMDAKQSFQEENVEMKQSTHEGQQSIHEENQSIEANKEEESMFIWCLFEELEDKDQEFEEEEVQLDMEDALEEFFEDEIETGESNIEKVKDFEEEIEDTVTEITEGNEVETYKETVMEIENGVPDKENTSKKLPECLLLMMYEPKLSMEVSKETWVCSSDFIRRHSSRKKPPPLPPLVKSIDSQDESKVNASNTNESDNKFMRMVAVQYEPGLHQPSRSSCSLPAPRSMATMLEQKLVDTKGYEPLVLKRCKSEPRRIANANLPPETCLWRNKLEPPRQASFCVDMAGLGF